MLSDQKRGWQGRSGGVVSATKKEGSFGRRRTRRSDSSSSGTTNGERAKTDPLRPPKDHSQFQREWRRRCRTDGERREYLRLVGPEKLSVLFRVEMEPDVLIQVLSLICCDFSASPAQDPPEARGDLFECCTDTSDGQGSPSEPGAASCLEWLCALTKTGRFAVNILFLEDEQKQALRGVFQVMTASLAYKSDEDARRIESLRQAYTV